MAAFVDQAESFSHGAAPGKATQPPTLTGVSNRVLTVLTALVFFSVAGVHLYTVITHVVNVPYSDEWWALDSDALPAGVSWRWISAFSNEHRIVPTRLLTAAFYSWTRWNLRYQQIANLGIFAMVLASLVYVRSLAADAMRGWTFFAFLVFLLSPIACENHSTGMQSCFHFVLAFSVMSAALLFHPRRNTLHFLLGLLFLAGACFSLATGVAAALAIVVIFTYVEVKRKGWLALGALYLYTAMVLAIWFHGYVRSRYYPGFTTLLSTRYWVFFLNLVGLGFGFTAVSAVSGGIVFAVVVIPIARLLLRDRRDPLPEGAWPIVAATVGVLAMLASVTAGRVSFPIAQSKMSRYAEIGFVLIALAALLWSVCLRGTRLWRNAALLSLWCLVILGYHDNWAFAAAYEQVRTERLAGLGCVKKYLEGEGSDHCPMIFSLPIGEKANTAKRLGLSFVDDVRPTVAPGLRKVSSTPPVVSLGRAK